MEENTAAPKTAEVTTPVVNGAYTIYPQCGCGCKKPVKVANALVNSVDPKREGTVDWFRARHHPNFSNSTVTFRTKEQKKEKKNG
jgi:hypothetical protein